MTNTIRYEHSVCAFLDILGFEAMVVSKTDENKAIIDHYYKVINEIEAKLKSIDSKANIKILAISDSIILSSPISKRAESSNIKVLQNFFTAVNLIQYELASHDIWIRGGISFGEISFKPENNFIVGEGYIKAYKLEGIAKYPRTIIDPKIIKTTTAASFNEFIARINNKDFSNWTSDILYSWEKRLQDSTELSRDIPLFLDYLSPIFDTNILEDSIIIDNIKKNIINDLKHYPKYQWLVNYLKSKAKLGNFRDSLEKFYPSADHEIYKTILSRLRST